MASQIAAIVDYSAIVAARIQNVQIAHGLVIGVRAVFATGAIDPRSGDVFPDPLRPGQPLQPAPENPPAPYVHFSDLPDAPGVTWLDQEGDVQLDWQIPMRLWLPRSNLAATRQTAMPFYAAYLREFHKDRYLGGLCLICQISRFAIGGDDNDCWLDTTLDVTEQVALADE